MKIAGLADKIIRVGVFAPAGVVVGSTMCCIGVIEADDEEDEEDEDDWM